MLFKQIPKNVLIHSVEYHQKKEASDFVDSDLYNEPITINNCRVQVNKIFNKSKENDIVNYNALLFLDVDNTTPFMDLKGESKVIFNNKEFFVVESEDFYTTKLHHKEVKLK